mmetsp:Transcript_39489/g.61576  ORF Transcript_39489/g.61576 Transcript_39489/m.61576 type:complete len:94 (-) Transcript_39489:456-737(-)
MTFTPPGMTQRKNSLQMALQSYGDADIDVLLNPRCLLLFCGTSRHGWRRAIRPGVEVDTDDGHTKICDWFGTANNLIPRNGERISISISFARK